MKCKEGATYENDARCSIFPLPEENIFVMSPKDFQKLMSSI